MLDHDVREALLRYVSADQPMGPVAAEEIDEDEDPKVADLFFQSHNKIYEQLLMAPSFIVGRKGSGKTAFLNSLRNNPDYAIVVGFDTAESFLAIVQIIQQSYGRLVWPELVAREWDKMFWLAILTSAAHCDPDDPDIKKICAFLEAKGFGTIHDTDAFFQAIVNGQIDMQSFGFRESNWTLTDAKDALIRYLVRKKKKAALLFDSLERFRIQVPEVELSLAGFMRSVATFGGTASRCTVRACLPAEVYHILVRASANPIKDFQRRAILHWHASELVYVFAHRLSLYLQLYYPVMAAQVSELDIDTKSGAKSLIAHVLPPVVVNRLGIKEETLGYLFRHTQLLPRQMLLYVNAIFRLAHASGNGGTVDKRVIVEGISSVEDEICADIIAAYSDIYPNARGILENAIPNLPFRFHNGVLHRVFNQHAKKILPAAEFDYRAFKRMLVEIGVVGKVIDESERYVFGLFEYTLPSTLNLSDSDEMCLHPVFVKVFNAVRPSKNLAKLVYPYGTDPDGNDNRDF